MRDWKIDPSSSVPIFQQIVDCVERKILSGALRADDYLPSVRELAVKMSVNPNTVAKAFQILQQLRLVESDRGKGLKVLPASDAKLTHRKEELVASASENPVDLAQQFHMKLPELQKVISQVWKEGQP